MMETVEHPFYGRLPVVDILTDCHDTRTGWTGWRKRDGARFDTVYDPSLLKYYRPGEEPVARLPDNDVLISRDKEGRILGAIRIERRLRAVPAAVRSHGRLRGR